MDKKIVGAAVSARARFDELSADPKAPQQDLCEAETILASARERLRLAVKRAAQTQAFPE